MTRFNPEDVPNLRVLVVGDAMMDRYWFGDVERVSPEAPVPVLKVTREENRLGGAANVALNAKHLGARVTLMTCAGADEASSSLDKLLRDAEIDRAFVWDNQLTTIVKLRLVGRSQQLVRADFDATPDGELLKVMSRKFTEALSDHDVVIFSDYGKGNLSRISELIAECNRQGKPSLVDPKGVDFEKYSGAVFITPNKNELRQVLGSWASEDDLREKALKLLNRLRLKGLLLTRSEEGMSLFMENGLSVDIPAEAKEVFDVTGAGDTCIAVMAVMIGLGQGLEYSARIANKAAGRVVGKFGTASISLHELF